MAAATHGAARRAAILARVEYDELPAILDLRIGQANQYTNVLEDQAIAQFLAGELTREEAMQQIYDAWQGLTDQIGREQQAAAYADSLNVER